MTQVTLTITATLGNPLTSTVLVDNFPAGWTVITTTDGLVSDASAGRKKISWPFANLKAGDRISSTYVLRSPTLTNPPTTYQFQSELDYGSRSSSGSPWSVIVADPMSGPTYPYARGLTGSSIAIAWVPATGSNITGYKVYRGPSSSGPFAVITTTTGGQMVATALDTGLQASSQYFYLVSSYDGAGESPMAGPISATTTPPDPPKGLRAAGGSGGIGLNWIANGEPNIAGYNVYRSDTSNGSFSKINSSPVATTAYTDTAEGLNQTSQYYYRVTALDSTGGEGNPSPESFAKPVYNLPTSGPHGNYTSLDDTCAKCHRTHTATGPQLISNSSQKDLCFSCHDGTGSQYNVTAQFTGTLTSSHPVATDVLKCSDCHDPHVKPQTVPKLLDAGGKSSGNDVCYACHGTGSTLPGGDHQIYFETGYHKAGVPNPPSGTQIQCSSCHQPHSSNFRGLEISKDENTCYSCHDGSTSGANLFSKFKAVTGPPNVSSPSGHHDVSDADQAATGAALECTNCHNPHTTASSSKVVDPDAPSMPNIWTGTKTDFCLKCHDGSFPTAAQTGPYAPEVKGPTTPLINIKSVYSSTVHSSLSCDACHDSHGSANPYQLKTSMTSPDGTTKNSGELVMPLPGGGYDFRYFCNSCHQATQMGNSQALPTNCLTCHTHGTNF